MSDRALTEDESGYSTIGLLPPGNIILQIGDIEFLRLEPNGDIYVKGKLAENDKEVVHALREFLTNAKFTPEVKE